MRERKWRGVLGRPRHTKCPLALGASSYDFPQFELYFHTAERSISHHWLLLPLLYSTLGLNPADVENKNRLLIHVCVCLCHTACKFSPNIAEAFFFPRKKSLHISLLLDPRLKNLLDAFTLPSYTISSVFCHFTSRLSLLFFVALYIQRAIRRVCLTSIKIWV